MIGAVCAIAACQNPDMDIEAPDNIYKVVLSGDCDTKTSFAPEVDGYRQVLWKSGDMLGLFVKRDGSALASAQNVIARLEDADDKGPGYSQGSFATSFSLSAFSRLTGE